MDGRVEMWMSAQTTSTTAAKTQFVVMPLGLITALVKQVFGGMDGLAKI